MKILVTGGAGFIGSHLVERLVSEGHEVTVLDDFSTGSLGNLPSAAANLEVVQGDVADEVLVRECVEGIDAIFHLAAVASVQASIDDPLRTHRANLIGTIVLLEAARRCGVERFVYASSAAVYGDVETLPVHEEASVSPLSPYAVDKLAGEHYLESYCARFGMTGLAFRFFNVYGPRQDPSSPYSGVISIFANRARDHRPVTIFGDGRQSRDFIYVEDLIDILVRGLRAAPEACVVANVGTGTERTLLDLLDALEQVVGHPIEREHMPARSGDIRRSVADTRRLHDLVGDVSWTGFEEGLRKTLKAGARSGS